MNNLPNNAKLIKLYRLLSDKSEGYYSLEINYTAKKVGLTTSCLRALDIRDSEEDMNFRSLVDDCINVFIFNDVEYIGLETRRLDYDRDALAGTNKIEDAVKRGDYNLKKKR